VRSMQARQPDSPHALPNVPQQPVTTAKFYTIFVTIKSVEQQDIQAAHRMRAILLRHRTALINQMRGLLGERGLAISRSPEAFSASYRNCCARAHMN